MYRAMNIKVHAPDLPLTPAISGYIEKRMRTLEKFIPREHAGAALMEFEIGKVSHRHKQGEVYRAEANLSMPRRQLRAEASAADVYAAIDEVKEELERELTSVKSKERTLFRRGAAAVKDILKGFGKFKWKNLPKMPRWRKK